MRLAGVLQVSMIWLLTGDTPRSSDRDESTPGSDALARKLQPIRPHELDLSEHEAVHEETLALDSPVELALPRGHYVLRGSLEDGREARYRFTLEGHPTTGATIEIPFE